MLYPNQKQNMFGKIAMGNKGFTMVELIVALFMAAIIGMAVVMNYASQEQTSRNVSEVADMQQQLRGAIYMMEQDIRVAGYDPANRDLLGVTNVQRWSITDQDTPAALDGAGSPSISVTADWNENGLPDDGITAYRLFDDNADGITDLVMDDGTNPRPLMAEGIEAIGFAYAIDGDNDGNLDRTPGNNIIWAVDTDNDNELDVNLDTDDNGIIDINDDTDGDNRITVADGVAGALAAAVPVSQIRMVRIWLLARGRNQDSRFSNTDSILVGNTVMRFNDNFRRRLLVRSVDCRNMGL